MLARSAVLAVALGSSAASTIEMDSATRMATIAFSGTDMDFANVDRLTVNGQPLVTEAGLSTAIHSAVDSAASAKITAIESFLHAHLCPGLLSANMVSDMLNGKREAVEFCKYSCTAGHHDALSLGTCTPCTAPSACAVGSEHAVACSTEADNTCSPCTTKPEPFASAGYSTSSYTSSGSCAYECTGGYAFTLSDQCDQCEVGFHDGTHGGLILPAGF